MLLDVRGCALGLSLLHRRSNEGPWWLASDRSTPPRGVFRQMGQKEVPGVKWAAPAPARRSHTRLDPRKIWDRKIFQPGCNSVRLGAGLLRAHVHQRPITLRYVRGANLPELAGVQETT
jgi:hypothetical protein